jgi:hypothetical protein
MSLNSNVAVKRPHITVKFSVVVVKGQAGHQSTLCTTQDLLLCHFLAVKDRPFDAMATVLNVGFLTASQLFFEDCLILNSVDAPSFGTVAANIIVCKHVTSRESTVNAPK